ncbi:MAG: methyltransferase domain-containing protein [Chloroflexi bacterium]|nr:methyltransferase domain-containing protein [Chloroflexota bacterium]
MSQQRAQMWSQIAANFDQIGPPIFAENGRRLVELAQIPNGAAVLDVAAGRGASLFPVAAQIGESGRAVGVDLAAGMTRELAAETKRLGVPTMHICQMDGERLAFAAAAFDAVLCGHAIFYFPPAAAEFYRVLRPDGRLSLSIVAQGTFDWLWRVFARHTTEDQSPNANESEQNEPAINTPDGLRHLLRQAGFAHIQIREEATDYVYADEAEWLANLWALGTRRVLEKMDAASLTNFESDLFATLQPFKQTDGIHIPFRVLYASGRKPALRA